MNINEFKDNYLNDDIMEKVSYLFFGGLTTLVNIFCYWILTHKLKMYYVSANIIAWVAAVLFAFVTNKLFVFKSHTKDLMKNIKEMVSFFSFRGLSLLLDLGTMFVLVQLLTMNDIIAKVISNVLVIIVNYFASKLFIFKKAE